MYVLGIDAGLPAPQPRLSAPPLQLLKHVLHGQLPVICVALHTAAGIARRTTRQNCHTRWCDARSSRTARSTGARRQKGTK